MDAKEKINSLTNGSKIAYNGKVYTVISIKKLTEKVYRHSLAILEEGKPETRTVAGRFLAEGKTFEISNIRIIEVSILKPENNWELI